MSTFVLVIVEHFKNIFNNWENSQNAFWRDAIEIDSRARCFVQTYPSLISLSIARIGSRQNYNES